MTINFLLHILSICIRIDINLQSIIFPIYVTNDLNLQYREMQFNWYKKWMWSQRQSTEKTVN